jgi:hypothetical protein
MRPSTAEGATLGEVTPDRMTDSINPNAAQCSGLSKKMARRRRSGPYSEKLEALRLVLFLNAELPTRFLWQLKIPPRLNPRRYALT